ncbi:MAG: diacylglycerol kinase family lipid kinase [Phycisphaerae bacterium]|nr:diacylglycerol kinase family lipid kinase [Phycisphaerae bacterium]NIX28551.1 YegS/Rv2252/BmrU family lipid kinase [Phycisphaerae bacterium]
MRTQLVINPQANRGQALKVLPLIKKKLNELNILFDVKQTEAPRQAVDLARQAAIDGYERIVAVGGDGTCNEVINGLLKAAEQGYRASLGIIPVGSGNDFAYSLDIPLDYIAACIHLKNSSEQKIDAGQVIVDGQTRFFANSVGLGLDAEVAVDTLKATWLRGFAMYLWSAFRVIAFGKWPYKMNLSWNDTHLTQPLTLISIANGRRVGGGFLLTPDAKMNDGWFDICYADALPRHRVVSLLPKTLNGSHINHPAITMIRTKHLKISLETGVPAHIDGEILCRAGREFEFEILPNTLLVWA